MGGGLSEVRRGEHRHHNGSDQNGANIKMDWGADSVDAGHSQGDRAGGSMSGSLDQVVAAVSNSTYLWEGATQKLLQFCVETGKRAKETNSELEAVRKEVQVLKQSSEESIASLSASLSACKAQQIRQEDYIG